MSTSYMQYLKVKMSENKDQSSTEGDTGRALVDGTTNYRRKQTNPSKPKEASCTTRLLIFFTIFFFLTTAGVLAVFLWREFVYHQESGTLKERVLQKYPSYFRTPAEQETFIRSLILKNAQNPIPVTNEIYSQKYCSINCPVNKTVPQRRKRETYAPGSIFHGCCVSNTYFSDPDTKVNIAGDLRAIVHYSDKRQYFQEHNCSHVAGCTGCTCSQDHSVQTGLVISDGVLTADDIDDFEVDWFYFDGCCTCRNT